MAEYDHTNRTVRRLILDGARKAYLGEGPGDVPCLLCSQPISPVDGYSAEINGRSGYLCPACNFDPRFDVDEER